MHQPETPIPGTFAGAAFAVVASASLLALVVAVAYQLFKGLVAACQWLF